MRWLIVRKPTLLPSVALHRSRRLAQTLAHATTKEHVLIQIQPKTLVLLQDGEGADHVMLTLLALQHGHLKVLQMAPSRLETPPVMPIAGKLMGICASTGGTCPLDKALSATDLTRNSLLSS